MGTNGPAAADCTQVSELLAQAMARVLLPDDTHCALLSLGAGGVTLRCDLQQPLLVLDTWALPARRCACHGLPMRPPVASAAALAATAGCAADAAAAAALPFSPCLLYYPYPAHE